MPLTGIEVVEVGGGAAAAYCGRLLADAGASVAQCAVSEDRRARGIVRSPSRSEAAQAAWLSAGKRVVPAAGVDVLAERCRTADLVLVGEESGFDVILARPRRASIDLRWFGRDGVYRDWRGSDLIVQALTGLPQMAGPADGTPLYAGDRHATAVAGVSAYIAAVAALLAPAADAPRRYELGVFESNLVLSEMHMHFFERDGIPMKRYGINRFHPNGPVGVYPCSEGWVGITATTPEQWKSLCIALGMAEQAADERLVTRELRFDRLDEVEAAILRALSRHPAAHWAELGRRHKVPIVIVPDAAGIRSHPVFTERGALARFTAPDGETFEVPRTPFALTRTPVAERLDAERPAAASQAASGPGTNAAGKRGNGAPDSSGDAGSLHSSGPLAGVTVVDFAMGWAGPLATRLLADLGADVLKIEAGRYPDWWRGVNWTPEYIEARGYEEVKGFCAMNRGKRGVSVDLTTDAGRELALELIARADAVVENQAAGVMEKLGLGHPRLAAVNPGLVMLSMSAFGTGNAWSDTRAYGSTLEQGAGLPVFMGEEGTPPTMYQLAYGDPVGGLFGCAALLTALFEKRRSGRGQYVNLSMVEAMLQFATPALLEHQVEGRTTRRGNRHASFAPHGLYPVAGDDQWIALAVEDAAGFARLAEIVGRPEWAAEPALESLEVRQARAAEIDAAITAWSATQPRDEAARHLQAAGIAAAPLLHVEELFGNPHLEAEDFYLDLERAVSGPQRQAGISIRQDGRRLGARRPAPLMGEHSHEVLVGLAGVEPARYDALVRDDVITFAPKALRSVLGAPVSGATAAAAATGPAAEARSAR